MNGSLAYQEEPREELLNGKITLMAGASVNHNRAASMERPTLSWKFFLQELQKMTKAIKKNCTKMQA